MMNRIDIHADDYGYTLNTSKEIIDLMKEGLLDSFSIIPNTSSFEDSINLLYKAIPSFPFLPKMSVHINLVEGYSLSKDRYNTLTWGTILLKSITNNKLLKSELKKEIKMQIVKTSKAIDKCIQIAKINEIPYSQIGLRIDSHTHTHAIPFVFQIITEIIEEENIKLEYIRNPKEPIIPFIKNISTGFKPMNFIKNLVLNVFSFKIDKYLKNHNIPLQYMWGLVMSGNMNVNDTNKLFFSMTNYSRENNRILEILFHPGIALKEEMSKELNKKYFGSFNSSKNRKTEKESVIALSALK